VKGSAKLQLHPNNFYKNFTKISISYMAIS